MAFLPDQHFSTFHDGGDLAITDIVVGLRAGINTRFNYTGALPPGVVVQVNQGGTGRASAIPYAIIAGGTDPTSPFQNVDVSGKFGEFLMFDTSTSLPVWRTAASKYIVGPLGPYNTIQSAINQAVADGASASNILNVLITAGVYVENLVLHDFVDLSGAGAQDCVVIRGNATYTSVAANGSFSTRGITYTNDINASPTISIQGANTCNINIAQCNINGVTSNTFQNLNANANIEKSTCKLSAAAGKKIADIVGGVIRVIAGFANSVDTASTISSGANFAILGSFDTNSFIVTGASTFSVTNSVIIPPDMLTFATIDNTSVGIILFSSILSNSASGFYIEGNGTVIIGGVNTIVGSADTIDPGVTIFAPGSQFGGIKLLNQSNAISLNNNLINNVSNPISAQDAATKSYVDAAGVVNSGTQNQLAWYATTGKTLSGLTTAANGLLVTSAGGVPSIGNTIGSSISVNGNITANSGFFLVAASTTAAKGSILVECPDNVGNFANVITSQSTTAGRSWTFPDATGIVALNGTAITATSITFDTTSGIIGTTTNDNAAAGSVGEYLSSVISNASAVSLSNNTSATVTSLSLTAGDWDVFGNISLTGGATTLLQYSSGNINAADNIGDPSLWNGPSLGTTGVAVFAENQYGYQVPYVRMSLGSTTTVYLVVIAGFSVSTCKAAGGLFARRVR